MIATILIMAGAFAQNATQEGNVLEQMEKAIQRVVELARPSVVRISVKRKPRAFRG